MYVWTRQLVLLADLFFSAWPKRRAVILLITVTLAVAVQSINQVPNPEQTWMIGTKENLEVCETEYLLRDEMMLKATVGDERPTRTGQDRTSGHIQLEVLRLPTPRAFEPFLGIISLPFVSSDLTRVLQSQSYLLDINQIIIIISGATFRPGRPSTLSKHHDHSL